MEDNFICYKVRVAGQGIDPGSPTSPLEFGSVNKHVLICGTSGSGKSFFASHLFPTRNGLLLFKKDDLFQDNGIVRAIDKGLPDISLYDVSEVGDAYMYALKLDFSGIMAASLLPVFTTNFNNAVRSKTSSSDKVFSLFFKNLKKSQSNRLTSSVADLIHTHFSSLYPERIIEIESENSKPDEKLPDVRGNKPLTNFTKISFAGLNTFSMEFGAELILRNYYNHMSQDNGILMIDEFHHVSRPNSIVDTLLREFRISGQLVAISQNLSDVSSSMLSNFGVILIGRSIHPDDLLYLSRLDPKLPGIVSSMPPYVFLNLSEYLLSPNHVQKPYYMWRLENEE